MMWAEFSDWRTLSQNKTISNKLSEDSFDIQIIGRSLINFHEGKIMRIENRVNIRAKLFILILNRYQVLNQAWALEEAEHKS